MQGLAVHCKPQGEPCPIPETEPPQGAARDDEVSFSMKLSQPNFLPLLLQSKLTNFLKHKQVLTQMQLV